MDNLDLDSLRAMASTDASVLTDEEMAALSDAAGNPALQAAHEDNLALYLDSSALAKIGSEAIEAFDADIESRRDWQYRERDGMRLLGVSENITGGADFAGASEVTYPGLIEAVIQFQARAIAELWPASGPARGLVVGASTPEREAQAKRVEDYLNYLYTVDRPGAFDAHDQMLFRLALSGSTFKKTYYDPLERKLCSRFIQSEDFVVPYLATDLRTTPRYTHVCYYNRNDLRKLQAIGYYRDVELAAPTDSALLRDERIVKDEKDDIDSQKPTTHYDAGNYSLLEQMCYIDLPGFEDRDENGAMTGIALPYFVTVERDSQEVLSIRRNWRDEDALKTARLYVTHYRLLPGFGFYGLGYLHILSHLARGETGALRALLDAGQFANLPGGFRSRDVRLTNTEKPIAPGEWRETEATAEELAKAFFKLPYAEPSETLFELLQWLDTVSRRLAGTTEVSVGDASNMGPVGTTLALIEQSQRPQISIHLRLHKAQQAELKVLHDLCAEWLPPEYPYDVTGANRMVKQSDFDGRVDVVPVSDPNIISATQRIALGQAVLALSKDAPDLYDRRAVHSRLLAAMRVANPDELLPPQEETPHQGPVEENMALTMSKPVKAYPDQDHRAHMIVHRAWFDGLDIETQNRLKGAHIAHIAEHQALDYQLAIQRAMGGGMQTPTDPGQENFIAAMAAQAAQVMAASQPPAAEEPPAPDQSKHLETQAAIERANRLADADIARKDALAIATMRRQVADSEAKLMERSAAPDLIAAAEEPNLAP